MKRRIGFITLIAAALAVTVLPINPARPASAASYTNSTAGEADSSEITRSVTVVETAPITDLDISITFTKTDGVCARQAAGFAFHSEIEFLLVSPSGTEVLLVNSESNDDGEPENEEAGAAGADKSARSSRAPSTYTGGGDIGDVTIYLDDEAGTVVGGVDPVSGTFRPVGSLAAFDGQNPAGTWTLRIIDTVESDPLCFFSFTLIFPDAISVAGCGNFGDGRVNNTDKDCIPPFVVYCIGTTVEIYDVDYTTSRGTLLVRWTEDELAEIGIPEHGPIALAEFDDMSFWRLETGELQGNGYTPEGKPYIFVWNGCPVSEYYHLAN